MTTKNKPLGREEDFHDFPQREDNGSTMLFLRDPDERELIPNIDGKTVMIHVSKERHTGKYPNMHEYLGSPKHSETEQLSDEEVANELDRLMKLMEQKELKLRTFTRISERELHRFITKELFPQLTRGDEMTVMGDLIYEEFHPNDHYLIKKSASDFLRCFLGQEPWDVNWEWETELENKKSLIWLEDQYESVCLEKLEFDELSIEDENTASLIFEISFFGHSKDGIFVHHFEGDGQVFLRKIKDEWRISSVHFPDRVG